MVTFPNAKINIGLFVTGKRKDNYHTIESIFYPVKFNDILEAGFYDPAFSLLQVSGETIDGNTNENLVIKAAQLIGEQVKNDRAKSEKLKKLRFFLHKNIPTGAGLGGGSADGTFALKMINNLLDLCFSEEKLAELSLKLGSDCPFFVSDQPSFVTGRGEIIEPANLNLSGYSLLLILPGPHISTAEAYSQVQPQKPVFDLRKISGLSIEKWKNQLANDFEKPVFEKYPEIKNIKEELYRSGAVYAQMSGSGSAIYGIFKQSEYSEKNIPDSLKKFRNYLLVL